MSVTVNDFFCGCGGVGLGFQQAGCKVVWACDFDKFAVQTYRKNVGDHVVQADIKQLTVADIPHADVWAFGFPCQDLSYAGKQRGFVFLCENCNAVFPLTQTEDDVKCPVCSGKQFHAASRSGMFFEIMRLLDETEADDPNRMPLALFIENVKGLKKYIPVLEAELKKRGYNSYVRMYNSKYWGVPQNRERYFIVGLRRCISGFAFPREQPNYVPKLSTILEENVDDKYFISDEKAQKIIQQAMIKLEKLGRCHATLTPDRIEKRQNGPRAKPDEEEMFTLTAQDIHGVIIQTPREKNSGNMHEISPTLTGSAYQQNNFFMTDTEVADAMTDALFTDDDGAARTCNASYQKGLAPGKILKTSRTHIVVPELKMIGMLESSGTTHQHNNRVYDPDGIAPTATAVAGRTHHIKIFDPSRFRVRKLTPTEYGRLQAFPMETWEQVVSDTQAYKQFGNAVTVNVVRAISRVLKACLENHKEFYHEPPCVPSTVGHGSSGVSKEADQNDIAKACRAY